MRAIPTDKDNRRISSSRRFHAARSRKQSDFVSVVHDEVRLPLSRHGAFFTKRSWCDEFEGLSPSHNDELRRPSACRKVESRFSFVHKVSSPSVVPLHLSRFIRSTLSFVQKSESLKKSISGFIMIDLDQPWWVRDLQAPAVFVIQKLAERTSIGIR